MRLHDLPKIKRTKKRRLGRGYGSGRGKTAGRGTKGQKARSKVKPGFEGGQLPIFRRIPFKRGMRNPPRSETLVINVRNLNIFSDGDEITLERLAEAGFIPKNLKPNQKVKILGDGDLERKLIVVGLSCSKGAIRKIEEKGGKVENARAD